jgi:hypothetical protein
MTNEIGTISRKEGLFSLQGFCAAMENPLLTTGIAATLRASENMSFNNLLLKSQFLSGIPTFEAQFIPENDDVDYQ